MFSFPKSDRLLKREEFTSILDNGIKVVDSNIVVLGKHNAHSRCRMGLIVSKKVGNAVIRNQVKRHLRESFRNPGKPDMVSPIDFVVIARAKAAKAGSHEIAQSLGSCLKRLGKKLQK
tara:strand:+ start:435 stop:788 length:354 start_codon:yes stop_codon:yes gene_type:complete